MKKLLLTIAMLSTMISYANTPDAQSQEETASKGTSKKNSQYAYAAANLVGIGLSIKCFIESKNEEDKLNHMLLNLGYFGLTTYARYTDNNEILYLSGLANTVPLAYNIYRASQGESSKLMATINLLNIASGMRPLMFEW